MTLYLMMKITEEFITSSIDKEPRIHFGSETWRKTLCAYKRAAPHWLLRLIIRYLLYFCAVVFLAFIFFLHLSTV